MSLTTPGNLRELQRKLYIKAKQEPNYRFYSLYGKIYREGVARQIADGPMLHLLKMWLKAPVEERHERGNRKLAGGQSKGTPWSCRAF